MVELIQGCDGSVLLDDTTKFIGEKTAFPNLNSIRGFNVAARDSVSILLSNFQAHGLNPKDLVVLSAAHTIGLARCTTFRARIYNDTNIDPKFAASAKYNCPTTRGDNNTRPLDSTTRRFDNVYFKALLQQKGLLHSDKELYKNNGTDSDKLVLKYSRNSESFAKDFANSMINMGNIKPLTGNNGEVRLNCRKIN
ncbi:unnamed protein product [Prunus armeniaca]|uniref:peroxidase n=1 Tax=Prunus armeniaca TaxID=36596 RepID=A0A6J5XHD6_PRUAR|nr:unnamed protein product [Prunus armeniaca]